MTETKTTVHDVRTFTAHDLKVTRDVGSTSKEISGYAVMFNQPSKPLPFTEYIDPHAFDDVDMSEVQLLYSHNYDNILARADSGSLSLKTDDKGLFFSAQIPDTTLGSDVYNNVKNGNLKGLSFSADIAPGGDDWDTQQDGTVVHTIRQFSNLYEISLTPIPAYTETSVQVSRDYQEVLKNMDKSEETQTVTRSDIDMDAISRAVAAGVASVLRSSSSTDSSSASTASSATSTASSAASSASSANTASSDASSSSSSSSASSASSSASSATSSSTSSASSSSAQRDDKSVADVERDAAPTNENQEEQKADVQRSAEPANSTKGENIMKNITPDNQTESAKTIKRDFAHYLATGEINGTVKRAEPNGVNLANGSVLIPETILTPEHEQHQFPRLGNLVRTISVSTTTGKLPVFQTSDDVLDLHTEFDPSTRHKAPEIVPINWDLNTYTGNYAFSQDLLSDSSYNWESELSSRLTELRDNTNDQLIMKQLTDGVTATQSDDLVQSIKEVLDSKLKPQDSNAASIVLSQSAFYALDKMEDKMGRPLVQPDVTQPTGRTILGKTVVVIDDTLFPKAKAGDANIVIAPLQKAVINFHENEITGRFIDQYDVWYRILGIYMREDVVQARKDLINVITTSTATAKAVESGTVGK